MKKKYINPSLVMEKIFVPDVLTLSQNGSYDLLSDGPRPDMEWIFQ